MIFWKNKRAEIPRGGTTGQALIKNSNDDYDVTWGDVGGTIIGTSWEILSTLLVPTNQSFTNETWDFTGGVLVPSETVNTDTLWELDGSSYLVPLEA